MWQQLHYRERGSESECDRERASASITMAKCLRLPVAVFTLPYVAVSQAVFVAVYVSVSALESPGQLMYMCCLHAAVLQLLQLLFAFVCSEAFKKFTIQFFLLLIRSHTHTQTHTRSPSLTHPFLAVCLGTWHAFRIAFCIEFINI